MVQPLIDAGFRALEPLLSGDKRTGAFLPWRQPGLADITLVPQVFNSYRYPFDLSRFPTIERIYQTCMKLDAFAAADPRSQPDFEA